VSTSGDSAAVLRAPSRRSGHMSSVSASWLATALAAAVAAPAGALEAMRLRAGLRSHLRMDAPLANPTADTSAWRSPAPSSQPSSCVACDPSAPALPKDGSLRDVSGRLEAEAGLWKSCMAAGGSYMMRVVGWSNVLGSNATRGFAPRRLSAGRG
jgi:hypothetical protein